MNRPLQLLIAAALALACQPSAAGESAKPASKPAVERKDGFFGIHLDLHPNKSDVALGRDLTDENIRTFLRRVRPDYIQYDCVGVPGYSGYPTKIGWPAPGIVKDSLAMWRQVTREERVAFLIHYCVLWNQAAIEHHPDWAAVNANGVRDKEVLSIFSPFAEQLLIPQLKEAATLYDLDGAWMDADAWIARLDYAPAALAEWKRQTGLDAAPRSNQEPQWAKWKTFHRQEFEKYLCRYVDALHAHSPKFQIACNWMYSLLAGVWPVGSAVDYLSGDYPQHNSTDEARAEARYFASNGKPWDLLAWGFNKQGLKCPTQLKQEAAATIMHGGGWGIYYVPTRSGHVSDAILTTAGEVADFCRARQAVSFRSTTVPQVALLQSAETYWDQADSAAFGRAACREDTKGALLALLELHYSVDILAEHQLLPRLREFPVVVIPDAYKLTDEFQRALLDYVETGGSLVLLGEKSARLFERALGVTFDGAPTHGAVLGSGEQSVAFATGWQKVTPAGARVIGLRRPAADVGSADEPAATLVTRGQGRIAAVYGPVVARYAPARPAAIRDLIGAVLREAFPQPAVEADAPATVDLALRRTRDGRLSVHFLNLAKVQRGETDFPSLDPYPAAGPFAVRLRTPQKPAAVRWEPASQPLEWSWRDGVLTATVPSLEIHGVLVIESTDENSPVLNARVSWLGNTYPGAQRWVPQDIDALCVAPDGTLFSNVHWEEGGGNVTAFKDGQVLGPAMHTHGWGNQGGYAVAANATHLFIAGRMGNEGGGLKDPETWPPQGRDWIGVSRRPLADIRKAAPFPGGKGGKGDTLQNAFLVVDEVPVERKARDDRRANITGLAATPERLWVSCPYDDTIKVFDAVTMQRLAVWPVERAASLALDASGALWVLQDGDATNRPQVLAFDSQGKRLPGHIAFDAATEPVAICFAPDGRLLVANDGPRQQVLIFGEVGRPAPSAPGRPAPSASTHVGTLGQEGGIYAGRPGECGPLKFNRPRAIACDAQSNVFVAHHGSTGGGSTVLESYTLAGQLNWRLQGQTFVDMADVDPADDTQLFTKEERFELDYRRPRGKEWEYRGYTVHRFRYPDDPRLHIWSAGVWVRRIEGRRFLFVNDMNGEQLQLYRWGDEAAGESAIPSGLFAKRRLNQDGWPPHQPERGEWIWRDGNGNGAFDAGEFTTNNDVDASPAQGWWVDAQGGVWLASETKGIRYFPLQGLDQHGNPRWDFASVRSFPHPAGFKQLKRLRYDPSADRIYLGGTTEEHKNQHWKPMGPVLACCDGWVKTAGRAEPRWQLVAPYEQGSQGHSSCEPMGFDVAGEYLFVPYTGASKSLQFKTGHVEVFRADDGRSVGHFEPSPDIGEIGLQDIRECLRAHRRADGEYLVFLEDDYKAKVLLYRWKP